MAEKAFITKERTYFPEYPLASIDVPADSIDLGTKYDWYWNVISSGDFYANINVKVDQAEAPATIRLRLITFNKWSATQAHMETNPASEQMGQLDSFGNIKLNVEGVTPMPPGVDDSRVISKVSANLYCMSR
jgi:hypothetical protein